jgi:predicted metal-binding protein
MAICWNCGKQYDPNAANQRFCCSVCRDTHKAEEARIERQAKKLADSLMHYAAKHQTRKFMTERVGDQVLRVAYVSDELLKCFSFQQQSGGFDDEPF